MNIDINIEQIVADAVGAALSPEKLQPIITTNVEKAVKSAIDDAFGYRSPFLKLLEGKIAEAMPTDIEDIGRYGDLVLKAVSAFINETQQDYIRNAIQPKLEGMLKKLPSTMKLSELVKLLVEEFSQDHLDSERDGSEQPTIIVRRSTGICSGYWHLHIDPKEGKSEYGCRIRADFQDSGKCYSLKIDDEDMGRALLIGPTYNADALMLNIYTGGITIELDETDFSDVYYPGSSYDD